LPELNNEPNKMQRVTPQGAIRRYHRIDNEIKMKYWPLYIIFILMSLYIILYINKSNKKDDFDFAKHIVENQTKDSLSYVSVSFNEKNIIKKINKIHYLDIHIQSLLLLS